MRWWKTAAAFVLSAAIMTGAEPLRKLSPFGSVHQLSVLPLSELRTDNPELAVEPGVSYLIRAGTITVLMDTGWNRKAEHPSPLLRNMRTLKVEPGRIGMLFFSHLHPDHIGGMREFSISRGPVALGAIPAFAPAPINPSEWNPEPGVQVLDQPRVLASGIASMGQLPGPGKIVEQALAINLNGRGIVLFSGCGHPTLAVMVKRARELFTEPIYGIVGGLHLLEGGLPADEAMAVLKALTPRVVAISPHDTTTEIIERFKAQFPGHYREILVGKELSLED
ncbi:MAG TPA: MBL fold metallo-hydrolase [Bryobacteraceae bacterium]|nr:MBL fold metallo-hydrolase [Bryobacteraceae bacterium]